MRQWLPLAALVAALAVLVAPSGANQSSHYALVRAFADGTPKIDRWQAETPDKSFYEGHFYSVKAPGLAAWTLPWYLVADVTGLLGAAERAGERVAAEKPADAPGDPRSELIREQRSVTWLLGLWAVVLPMAALLVLVRWAAERVAPGFGTATAVALGLGTLLLAFGTLLYAHALSALLAFSAFCVLWRERDGPPRPWLVAAAGALSGLAVVVEYPVALAGAVVGLLALAREPRVRRGLVYAGGVLAGVAPLLAFNVWAFGSPLHNSYEDAVAVEGATGRDVLGLNDDGLFGVTLPSPGAALDLLLAGKGLLALTPLVAVGAWGLWRLARAPHERTRLPARVALGVVAALLLYVSGYYLPFAGDVPGPRLLVPALPFLALGVAFALRTAPGATLALGAASVVGIGLATITEPQLRGQDTATWVEFARAGDVQPTLAAALADGWLQAAPFVGLLLLAAVLAWRATPWSAVDRHGVRKAALALTGWAVVAAVVPPLVDDRSAQALWLVAAATLAGALTLTLVARRPSSPARAPDPPHAEAP